MHLDGYSGLTYSKHFGDIPRKFRVMKSRQIDVLSIDLGTNDLCGISNTASVVVENAMQCLDLLEKEHIYPKCIICLPVIQRTSITKLNHVDVKLLMVELKDSISCYHRSLNTEIHM